MTKIYDGGPAFPTPENKFGEYTPGLSLRDWFAGRALLGCMLRCAASEKADGETVEGMFSRRAYEVADAMLEARKKGKPNGPNYFSLV